MTARSEPLTDHTPTLLGGFVDHYAVTDLDRVALIFEDNPTTYAELRDRVDALAKALLASGIDKGDRVASMSTPRPEFLISYLATISIGAVWMGLNPRYSVRELTYVLSDAAPSLVFTIPPAENTDYPDIVSQALSAAQLDRVPLVSFDVDTSDDHGFGAFLKRGDQIPAADLQAARSRVDPQDPAIVVYTSGSTGEPKGALIRHSGIVRLGQVQSAQWNVEQPRIICNQPINHIGCVGDLCSVTLVAGGSIVFKEKFDADDTLKTIEQHRVSGLFQIPTQLQRLAASTDFNNADLSSLKLVGWGGAPLPLPVITKFRERGCGLSTTYGLTEVTSSVTYTAHDASDNELANTVGRPDPELDVRLLSSDGTWADAGDEGEVCVKHPTVMAGYLNRPIQTQEAFTPDGWLRTGDLGKFRPDGNLTLVGRLSEMYKSGGYNIYPREIEQVLESFPGVALAAVVARPDADYYEVGVAFVQPVVDGEVDVNALDEWSRAHLANYKIPKELYVTGLPLLPNGKVDKQKLRKRAADLAG